MDSSILPMPGRPDGASKQVHARNATHALVAAAGALAMGLGVTAAWWWHDRGQQTELLRDHYQGLATLLAQRVDDRLGEHRRLLGLAAAIDGAGATPGSLGPREPIPGLDARIEPSAAAILREAPAADDANPASARVALLDDAGGDPLLMFSAPLRDRDALLVQRVRLRTVLGDALAGLDDRVALRLVRDEGPRVDARERVPAFVVLRPLRQGGSGWRLEVRSTRGHEAWMASNGDRIGAWGVVLSVALAALVFALVRRHGGRPAGGSGRQARRAMDAVPACLVVFDPSLRVARVNAWGQRMLALSGTGGLNHHWRERVHPEDRERLRDLARERRQRPEACEIEFRYRVDSGTYRWMTCQASPLWNDAGGFDGFAGVVVDVTERRAREAEREREHRFLADLIDGMPNPVIVKDGAHRFVMLNRAAIAWTGWDPAEVIGRTDREVHPPALAETYMAHDREVLAAAAPVRHERRYALPGGVEKVALVHKAALPLPDGRRGIVLSMTDVTEERSLASRLEGKVAFQRAIFESAGCAIVSLDVEGRIQSVNTGAERLLRRSRESLVGMRLPHLLGPGEPEHEWQGGTTGERFARFAESMRSQGAEGRDLSLVAGDAESVRVNATLTPMGQTGSGVDGYVFVGHDTTSRHRAELALRESESLMRATVWAADLGVWSWQVASGSVRLWPQYKRQLGYDDHELSDTLECWQAQVHPEDLPGAMAALRSAIDSGADRCQLELRMRHRDGRWRHMVSRAVVRRNADGQACQLVGGNLDVTEFRQAQEALRRHRDELEAEVTERTRELTEAKEAAEAASQTKSQFLANMSHELRTPMHAILSFARLGLERAGQGGDPKVTQFLGRIHQSGQRLLSLLNDLLDLSKLEAGRMSYELQTHDVRAVVEAAVIELNTLAEDKKLTLEVQAGFEPEPAWCDAIRLGQVLRNLLGNAIKFTPPGGRIEIAVLGVDLELADRTVPAVRIEVRDEGIGIPEDELEAVFDKFVQSTKTRSGAGGTGLGLSISREIVSQHGGRLWAQSAPGKGSTFVLVLPRERIEADVADAGTRQVA